MNQRPTFEKFTIKNFKTKYLFITEEKINENLGTLQGGKKLGLNCNHHDESSTNHDHVTYSLPTTIFPVIQVCSYHFPQSGTSLSFCLSNPLIIGM